MTSTLCGVEALPVETQVDVSTGLPAFSIVGLPDTAVQEARERVRSAIRSCGFTFPNARVIVNLAPGPLRKHGTGFDLPIALGILAATGQVGHNVIDRVAAVGELSLDGSVRVVPGMLAHALTARAEALVFLSAPDAPGPADLPGLDARSIDSLDRVRTGEFGLPSVPTLGSTIEHDLDLRDVVGHHLAKRALVIAAAGRHNLLMIGPPGSGKTMLARAIPGILPPLDVDERLETALVHGVAGLDELPALAGRRPFRAPHHSSSVAGLVGGGSPPRPGEASLAHNGVLFLDEMPEFGPAALQTLRQPLEDGCVTLVRASGRLRFPASFMLVGAANPCPCGFFGDPERSCSCTPPVLARYHGRIGGPLLDRIDLSIRVDRVDPSLLLDEAIEHPRMDSPQARDLVVSARALSAARPVPTPRLTGSELVSACRLTTDASRTLRQAARTHHFSGRAVVRLLRVARTIADLRRADRVEAPDVYEAILYRQHDAAVLAGCGAATDAAIGGGT